MTPSLTLSSFVALIIVTLAKGADIDIPGTDVENCILTLVQVASAVGVWYGRLRAGGVNIFGMKTK